MSAYLIAFIISDFSYLENKEKNFRIYARPNAIDQASYALRFGSAAIEYLENLFGSKYQLPELKMAAVPDFAAGAMENWGLITFREKAILFDDDNSSESDQQYVAMVVVHELVHNWFGNLVTPSWWSHLWLSEGFARYFQYMALDQVN